jgi:adenosylcobinamide hydrolase
MTAARRVYAGHGITAEVVHHAAAGVPATALALRLPEARRSLSGHGGLKRIRAVSNCYLPKELQAKLGTRYGDWRAYYREIHGLLFGDEVAPRDAVMLATGVDIENIAWRETPADDTWTLVLATAGVKSNALRIGHDAPAADAAPPGTINLMVLTGATLPAGAMAAMFVTVTEAKTIALQDLDIRSVKDPSVQASGTGTDELLVISGDGPRHRYTGGHTAFGAATARAVTATVTEAVRKTHGP